MTLGQRIQKQRKRRNLSQEALGEAMGVSRQAISKWESDLTIPEIDKLIALSKLFDMPVGQLLGVEEQAPAEQPGRDKRTRRWLAGLTALCLALTVSTGLLWGQTRRQAQVLSAADANYGSYAVYLFESVDYELSDLELDFPEGEGTQPLTVDLDMKPAPGMKGWDLTGLNLNWAEWDPEEQEYREGAESVDVEHRWDGTYHARFTRDNYGGGQMHFTAVFNQKGTGLVAKQTIFMVYGKGKGGIVQELVVNEYGERGAREAYLPESLALTLP